MKGKRKWRKEHSSSQSFILSGSLHCFSTHFTERDSLELGSVAFLRITLLFDKRQGNKVINVTFFSFDVERASCFKTPRVTGRDLYTSHHVLFLSKTFFTHRYLMLKISPGTLFKKSTYIIVTLMSNSISPYLYVGQSTPCWLLLVTDFHLHSFHVCCTLLGLQ